MSLVAVGFIGLGILFILIFSGIPIGASMALIGFAGSWYLVSQKAALSALATIPFATVSNYSLAVLPLFLFMASIVFVSGLSKNLYNLASKWMGHIPGGLAISTIFACAGFAAVSSSSPATAATLGRVSLDEMKKYKYSSALATGSVAAGGTLGILIPPSGVLIIYGVMTETSIGKLFAAGIIPGMIQVILYMIVIYILCRLKPDYGPKGPSFGFREKMGALGDCGEIIALILLVLGGLLVGWFTPTEAGGVGACGAIIICMVRRRLNWQKIKDALLETMQTTGMIYLILISAFILNYFITVTTIPFWLADFVIGLSLPPLGIMAIVILIYIILGCVMDAGAMIVLTIPIFFPMAMALGFDPVWFGIIITVVVEIGMITPPIGINVFVIAGVAPEVSMYTIFRGIAPFLIADFFRLLIYVLVPSVSLFLPSFMLY
jgi:C4-dicarboxylate transporter, DctM subunit